MNTEILYRAIAVGRDGKLINRESMNLTTFTTLKCGRLFRKEYIREVSRVEITKVGNRVVNAKITKVA